MLTFPIPEAIHGDTLEAQLAAAGVAGSVHIDGDDLCVIDVDEARRDEVAAVIEAHAPAASAAIEEADRIAGNAMTLQDRAVQALASNKAFLSITAPSNAQVVAQVKALARQNNAVIRLLLRRFESAD